MAGKARVVNLLERLKVERHCAYCLVLIPPKDVRVCGKCNRRTYCSKECQKSDWVPATTFSADVQKQRGQGHKDWCGLPYGEEDLDWKVIPIEGKGLGLIALRDFPPLSRIMVDACQLSPEAHPATKDLMPEGGTLDEKFQLNSLDDNKDDRNKVLCMRMSRANHNCDNNAEHMYDKTFKVKILFAEKHISAGEEICISYIAFNDIVPYDDVEGQLSRLWGVVCPSNCVCKDPTLLPGLERGRELDYETFLYGSFGNVETALEKMRELLELQKTTRFPTINRKRIIYDGFQIGIMEQRSVAFGAACAKDLFDLIRVILHPASEFTRQCDTWRKDPSTHHNYLLAENGEYNCTLV